VRAKSKQTKSRKSRNSKGERQTRGKENTPKYRPTLKVGEPFTDISQPTPCQIWLGRLKKSAKWLGGITVTTVLGKLLKKILGHALKRYFNLD
jgi:hypothetical protein